MKDCAKNCDFQLLGTGRDLGQKLLNQAAVHSVEGSGGPNSVLWGHGPSGRALN